MCVEFGSNPFAQFPGEGQGQAGVTWKANRVEPSTWSYGWVQVANVRVTIKGVGGNRQIPRQVGLDGDCPQGKDKTWGTLRAGPNPGQNLYFQIVATTWFMVESKTSGQWVPVDSVRVALDAVRRVPRRAQLDD